MSAVDKVPPNEKLIKNKQNTAHIVSFSSQKNIMMSYLIKISLNNNHILQVSALCALQVLSCSKGIAELMLETIWNPLLLGIPCAQQLHTSINYSDACQQSKGTDTRRSRELCAVEMWNLLSAVDTFVCLATSAVCAASQKTDSSDLYPPHSHFHSETLRNRHCLHRQMAAVKA